MDKGGWLDLVIYPKSLSSIPAEGSGELITDIHATWLVELEQTTPLSEIKGQVRHSNNLKKAGAYNGPNVVINIATKMRTIVRKM